MMRKLDGQVVNIGCVLLALALLLALLPTGSAMADGFRFRLNISYVDGVDDLLDQYEENVEVAESDPFTIVDVDTFLWPVGISLYPYYQWDSGLTLGAGIGPFMYLYAEGFDDDYDHWQIPLSLNVGYVLGPDNPVSFYVRGGPSYHVADGDFHDESKLGFVVAAGVDLLKSDHVALGIEAAYDSAEVKIDNLATGGTEDIKAAEFSVGLSILFK